MGNVIYTIGYGNMAPDDFVAKLKEAGITYVLDVRRKGSRSWCSKYGRGSSIGALLWGDHGREIPDIEYGTWGSFGNEFDKLEAYNEWLLRCRARSLEYLASRLKVNPLSRYCLLCAEKDVYDSYIPLDTGEEVFVTKCHRGCVAEALLAQLGEGWSVKHL